MLSITYFCRDNSSSGSDSSMQASLRRSKRAGEVGSEREAWLCSVGERCLPVPIPLGSSLHCSVRKLWATSWPNRAKGKPMRRSQKLRVSQNSVACSSKPCSKCHHTSELKETFTSILKVLSQVMGINRWGDDNGGQWWQNAGDDRVERAAWVKIKETGFWSQVWYQLAVWLWTSHFTALVDSYFLIQEKSTRLSSSLWLFSL